MNAMYVICQFVVIEKLWSAIFGTKAAAGYGFCGRSSLCLDNLVVLWFLIAHCLSSTTPENMTCSREYAVALTTFFLSASFSSSTRKKYSWFHENRISRKTSMHFRVCCCSCVFCRHHDIIHCCSDCHTSDRCFIHTTQQRRDHCSRMTRSYSKEKNTQWWEEATKISFKREHLTLIFQRNSMKLIFSHRHLFAFRCISANPTSMLG